MSRRVRSDTLEEEILRQQERDTAVIEKVKEFTPCSNMGSALKDIILIYHILGSDLEFIKEQFECYTSDMFVGINKA